MAKEETHENMPSFFDVIFGEEIEGDPLALETHPVVGIMEKLSEYLVGQPAGIRALADMVNRVKAGLNDPNRPLGLFLFVGPVGVGKAESGYALAQLLWGDPDSPQLKVVEGFLFDSPANGGIKMFDEQFLDKPNVIVFRDIEKCSPQQLSLILSLAEKKEFRNSYIILTHNVNGEGESKPPFGFLRPSEAQVEAKQDSLALKFRKMPEFMDRIDKVVAFNHLNEAFYMAIFLRQIQTLNERMKKADSKVPTLLVTPHCVEEFLKLGKPEYGAKGIKRAVERVIIDSLAEYVNSGIPLGETLVCDITSEGEIVFYPPKAQLTT